MSLTGQAIAYLQQKYPNAFILRNIVLQDDGQGPYVRFWNVGTPKPTEEEINIAAQSMLPDPIYPTVDDQLLMLYNDQKNNTKTFSAAIADYKAKKVK